MRCVIAFHFHYFVSVSHIVRLSLSTRHSAYLLANIKPIDVYKFLCFKACGIEDPGQDDQPAMRASTIAHYKKGISCFFHSTQKWNENSETGNPTYSNMVNNLLKVVTKQETRGNGAESQADRALTANEYYQVLELFRGDDGHTAMINFQHHLMARMDDVAHVKKETLKARLPLIPFPNSFVFSFPNLFAFVLFPNSFAVLILICF